MEQEIQRVKGSRGLEIPWRWMCVEHSSRTMRTNSLQSHQIDHPMMHKEDRKYLWNVKASVEDDEKRQSIHQRT